MAILDIKNIYKDKGNLRIFGNINLSVNGTEIIAFKCNKEIGLEFLQTLTGQASPSSGEVFFEGINIYEKTKAFSKKIGIYMDDFGEYERLKVKDYFSYFKKLYSVKCNIDEHLKTIGLEHKKHEIIKKLSYSEKKRLNIARAFLHNPQMIILEEPLQNVDLESRILIKRLIHDSSNEGKAILITSSSMEECLTITDNVYILNEHGVKKVEQESEADKDIKDEGSGEKKSEKNNKEEDAFYKIKKIPAKVNEKIILFNPTDITFVESSDGNSLLHTEEGEYICSITLTQLEERLKYFGFFRSHRSYLVNLQRVKEVVAWSKNSYSLILDDDKATELPLSKGRVDELKSILGI